MDTKPNNHCDICRLCTDTEQRPGSDMCKSKMTDRFINGYWHNGLHWHELKKGRVLTRVTFNNSKNQQTASLRNKNTSTSVVTAFSAQHYEILQEWSNDISAFQKQCKMEDFIFYMTTHPFFRIVQFSVDGDIVGFSWLIILDNLVIDQLFPWRKKRYSHLSLGVYENVALIKLWPDSYHFMGIDNEFKSKFGGWAYEGHAALQDHVAASGVEASAK